MQEEAVSLVTSAIFEPVSEWDVNIPRTQLPRRSLETARVSAQDPEAVGPDGFEPPTP
jgi:hypothetical protein